MISFNIFLNINSKITTTSRILHSHTFSVKSIDSPTNKRISFPILGIGEIGVLGRFVFLSFKTFSGKTLSIPL